MNIQIENCNNIDTATIALTEKKLNIKIAPNGTGKSTVAQAIIHASKETGLEDLMPFKLRESNPEEKQPTVTGIESLNNIACFNEDYVNQFVFKQDELLNNSFDILIRTEAYEQKEREIEALVSEIKRIFSDNEDLDKLTANLKEMGAAFKLTQTGISKASSGMKGLAGGNKIQHIPEGLEAYQPFIQSDNSVEWIGWQTKGNTFSGLGVNCCPFCTSQTEGKTEKIQKVGQEYDKNTIKNLINIIGVIDRLGNYFSDDAKNRLSEITTRQDGLEDEHIASLVTIKTQIDNLVLKLERLKTISGFQFKEDERVVDQLPSFKIDLQFFSELDSATTQDAVAPLNTSLEAIQERAGQLQGNINQQRTMMQRIIEKHQTDINGFLAYAGYKYKVEIAGEPGKAQLKLLHVDHSEHLSGGNQHLSFGERNAFSIVLFMYECLSKNPDLIILDDPISSFDKNKKYAIFEMLFRRGSASCLKNKSVLMFTHDVEPIIDTVKSLSHKFSNQTAASFLKLTGSSITEQDIAKDDIQTFSYICKQAMESEKGDLVKLIYLRRHYEISDDKGDAYQVLSNLFHKRATPIDTREPKDENGGAPELEAGKLAAGCNEIQGQQEGFSYTRLLAELEDENNLRAVYASCDNGYEKLQIFRSFEIDTENSVIQKFINETYHIENEFICQLDPAKFDTVPEYVIDACDQILQDEA